MKCTKNQLLNRPQVHPALSIKDDDNLYNPAPSSRPFVFQITKESAYWTQILMKRIRSHHPSRDKSYKIFDTTTFERYEMWHEETTSGQKVCLEPLFKEKLIEFSFGSANELL